mmetsp:Transcript_36336/g.67499  ORF Transcript_36336/g.67499 Transcript_36336/m.67499 type:complete len:181 (+) Transcript_36336:98-640(+)
MNGADRTPPPSASTNRAMAHIKAKSMESEIVAVSGSEPVPEAISDAYPTAVRDLMSSKIPAVEENCAAASHSTSIDNSTMPELPQDVNEATGVLGLAARGSQMGGDVVAAAAVAEPKSTYPIVLNRVADWSDRTPPESRISNMPIGIGIELDMASEMVAAAGSESTAGTRSDAFTTPDGN